MCEGVKKNIIKKYKKKLVLVSIYFFFHIKKVTS